MSQIFVKKASGQTEPFDEGKIRHSLNRAGIRKNIQEETLFKLRPFLYSGITTGEIYRHVYELLGKTKYPGISGRFSLKMAIMELGPSGFPFEKYVARVLTVHGYQTQVDQIISGRCVSHEIDVIARNEKSYYLVECKFHNMPGSRTDVKVTLYVQARFSDVTAKPDQNPKFAGSWIVTNTKFTSEAIQYAECVGLRLIGWDYPESGNLQDLVEKTKLYPITCLTTLSQNQKHLLLENGIVLCRELVEKPQSLNIFHQSALKSESIITEAKAIADTRIST